MWWSRAVVILLEYFVESFDEHSYIMMIILTIKVELTTVKSKSKLIHNKLNLTLRTYNLYDFYVGNL